jgi:IS1 family transposase
MNRLSTEKRGQIVGCLTEGMSIRATVRVTGAAKNTVTKLLVDLGQACAEYQDATLVNLHCIRIECDEIWAFCYAKAKNVPEEHKGTFGYGDVWTWTALCADTKLVPSWLVGERTMEDSEVFLMDLASRLSGRVQLSTDAFNVYPAAVRHVFGNEVDFGQIRKIWARDYGTQGAAHHRYSPSRVKSVEKTVRTGNPDHELINTSYVERQNLTMRMGMRRFTRLTNGFSTKVENLAHAVSLHYMHYNFARRHQSLSGQTPAMAAGVAEHPWSLTQIAQLLG